MLSAVNKAGRQRMLAERIVKSYVQRAEHISIEAARGQLADAIADFDRNLAELKELPAASTPSALAELEAQWRSFRKLALARPSREGVPALRAAGERLVEAAERNTAELARQAGSPAAHLVNTSGRLRMLCQRFAKCHLLAAGNFGDEPLRAELNSVSTTFADTLRELTASAHNTEEMRGELAALGSAWNALTALAVPERNQREAVLAAADALVRRIEHLTVLYERVR